MIDQTENIRDMDDYIRTKDISIRNRIVMRNLALAVLIAKKVSSRFNLHGSAYDDVKSEAFLALVQAIDQYSPVVGTPPYLWFGAMITWRTMTYVRFHVYTRKLNQSKLRLDTDVSFRCPCDDADIRSRLPKRERSIIDRRFGFDGYKEHTFTEIAIALGLSKQCVNELYHRAISRLKNNVKFTKQIGKLSYDAVNAIITNPRKLKNEALMREYGISSTTLYKIKRGLYRHAT